MWESVEDTVMKSGWLICVVACMAVMHCLSVGLQASVTNGDFSSGLDNWTVESGYVVDGGGFAVFQEHPTALMSSLSQVFAVPVNAEGLSFEIDLSSLPGGADFGFPPDAFTASLLDPITFDSLISNPGEAGFFTMDNTGAVSTIGTMLGNKVSLDVSALVGSGVYLVFDLIGGDDGMVTAAYLDNVGISMRDTVPTIPAPDASLLGIVGTALVAWVRGRARREAEPLL